LDENRSYTRTSRIRKRPFEAGFGTCDPLWKVPLNRACEPRSCCYTQQHEIDINGATSWNCEVNLEITTSYHFFTPPGNASPTQLNYHSLTSPPGPIKPGLTQAFAPTLNLLTTSSSTSIPSPTPFIKSTYPSLTRQTSGFLI
jgi:hypothetical protein